MKNRNFAKRKLIEWLELLHLQSWVVKLRLYRRLPLPEQYNVMSYSEKVARIGLNAEQQMQDELEHSLAHELAHLIESPQNRVFDNLVESFVPRSQRAAWYEQYNLAQNESIEHWLRVVYALMDKPYPPHQGE